MNDAPIAAPAAMAVTAVHVAAPIESHGCHGHETVGYAMYRFACTREDVDRDWRRAAEAAKAAVAAWSADNPCPAQPNFDLSWPGTRAEHRRAAGQAKTAAVAWQNTREAVRDAAFQAAWAPAAEFVRFRNDGPGGCGGEHDVVATAADGTALAVIQNRSCLCGHGGRHYSDDAADDDPTPRMWLAEHRTHPAAAALGGRFIAAVADRVAISAAFELAAAAAERSRARSDEECARMDRRLAVTDEELDAMTFLQWKQWQDDTEVRLAGGYPAGLSWRERWRLGRERVAAQREPLALTAAAKAAGEAGVFSIAEPGRGGRW